MTDSIPSFADMGKQAKDLFAKDYNYGYYKVEMKPHSVVGIDFILRGQNCCSTGAIVGSLDMKKKWSEYGLTTNLKWNTDNKTEVGISKDELLFPGIRVAVDGHFIPMSGSSIKLKSSYKKDGLINAEVVTDVTRPSVSASAVIRPFWKVLLGGQVSFDARRFTLSGLEAAIGFKDNDVCMHLNTNGSNSINFSMYQKVSDKVSLGAMKTSDGDTSKYELGCKFSPNENQAFGTKINNCRQIGLSMKQVLPNGLTIILSTLIDSTKLDQPSGHQFGIGIKI